MGSGEVEVNTWCLIARAVLIGGAVWETNWKITVEIVECKTVRDKDLLLTSFSRSISKLRILVFSSTIYGPRASRLSHKSKGEKTRSVTYGTDLKLG